MQFSFPAMIFRVNICSLEWCFPRKCALVLDSLPGKFIKPTVLKQVEKMVSLLVKVDQSIDIDQWSFFSNRPGEIPQQDNTYDCGIFTCLYARCLATRCQMIPKTEVPTYRQLLIQELHQKGLYAQSHNQLFNQGNNMQLITSKTIIIIFGWVIDKNDSFVKFKFLHRVSTTTYHWPRWDDMDRFHLSNIFAFCFSRPFKFQRNQLWKNSSE